MPNWSTRLCEGRWRNTQRRTRHKPNFITIYLYCFVLGCNVEAINHTQEHEQCRRAREGRRGGLITDLASMETQGSAQLVFIFLRKQLMCPSRMEYKNKIHENGGRAESTPHSRTPFFSSVSPSVSACLAASLSYVRHQDTSRPHTPRDWRSDRENSSRPRGQGRSTPSKDQKCSQTRAQDR